MRAAVLVALLGCGLPPAAPPAQPRPLPPPVVLPAPSPNCVEEVKARYAIDVSAEPRVCDPMREAVRPLGPTALANLRGLSIAREGRGVCGDTCPDLASALMSDAALGSYDMVKHAIHVFDATVDGLRWRGGQPTPAMIRAYLDGLGLRDWAALVTRVRKITGVDLPADVPEGAPLVFEAIVRRGPAHMFGGATVRVPAEISPVDLLRHEIGHALLLYQANESAMVERWSSLAGWTEPRDRSARADGYVGGQYLGEVPIVASRLLLGLPRGTGNYALGTVTPTRYAAFNPMEDHAESFRLAHADPVALGTHSPARLLVIAAGAPRALFPTAKVTGVELDLRRPELRRFIEPGVAALLSPEIPADHAMAVLRAHGAALLPEAARFADARPIVFPTDIHPDTRKHLETMQLVVEIGSHRFRPTDAALARIVKDTEAEVQEMEAFYRGLPGVRPD